MNAKRTIVLAAPILAAATALLTACAPRPGPGDPARHAAVPRDTVTVAADELIPNVPGKRLVSHVVDYPPGGRSASHRHARSAFIYAYVVSGAVRSQVNDGPARIYRTGEHWFEAPGSHHHVSENASDTEPARLLAVIVVDAAEKDLTVPDAR